MLLQREKLRESACVCVCVCVEERVKERKMKVKNNRRSSGKYYDKSMECKIIK